jgi:hypothetical protein
MGRTPFEQSTVWLRGLIEAWDKVASSTAKPSASDRKALANRLKLPAMLPPLGTLNQPGNHRPGDLGQAAGSEPASITIAMISHTDPT